MIRRVIEWCSRNLFLVFIATLLVVAGGVWSMMRIPFDALPDI